MFVDLVLSLWAQIVIFVLLELPTIIKLRHHAKLVMLVFTLPLLDKSFVIFVLLDQPWILYSPVQPRAQPVSLGRTLPITPLCPVRLVVLEITLLLQDRLHALSVVLVCISLMRESLFVLLVIREDTILGHRKQSVCCVRLGRRLALE